MMSWHKIGHDCITLIFFRNANRQVDLVMYFGSCVTEDDGLCYGKGVVKVTQHVKLPVFLFYSDEEWLEAFHHHFITFDKDVNGIIHEWSTYSIYRAQG